MFINRTLVKYAINGVNFVKIGYFRGKWYKLSHFWGSIWRHRRLNLGKVVKKFFYRNLEKKFREVTMDNLSKKKSLKGADSRKYALFSLYFLVKIPIHRLILQKSCTNPLTSTYLTKTNIFLKLHTSHYTFNIVKIMPQDFMGGGIRFRR